MSRVIQYPEERRGHLLAVAYGQHDVAVYDTLTDARQAVWNEDDLPEAVRFMGALNRYLDAYKLDVLDPSPESRLVVEAALAGLPEGARGPSRKVAEARYA